MTFAHQPFLTLSCFLFCFSFFALSSGNAGSNYVWQLFDVPKRHFSSKREVASLSASKEVPLSGFEGGAHDYAKTIKKKSCLFGKSGFACAFIQPSFVAFVGMRKNSNVITVWDLQYGIVHAEQNLERNTFEPSQLSDSFKLEVDFFCFFLLFYYLFYSHSYSAHFLFFFFFFSGELHLQLVGRAPGDC